MSLVEQRGVVDGKEYDPGFEWVVPIRHTIDWILFLQIIHVAREKYDARHVVIDPKQWLWVVHRLQKATRLLQASVSPYYPIA
jgi:hypothetical protein